jgi:hypothetical protein
MTLKKNRLFLVGGGTFVLLLLVEMAFLFMSASAFRMEKRLLKKRSAQLSRLHNRKPYPSVENVERQRKNLEQLEYQVGELLAALMRDPFPKARVEAVGFSAQAQGVIERLGRRAKEAGVEIPPSLEVGFSQYASGGTVPAEAHVPRLVRQLHSVERVADVLIRAEVGTIHSLSREIFEVQSAESSVSLRRRSRRSSPALREEGARHVSPSRVHAERLYHVERVDAEITARVDAIWRVLDLFASSPHFMVVAGFSHDTKADILSYNPEEIKRPGELDDETLRYLSEGILVGEQALSRSERIIAGNEPVRVRLSVDVYDFDPGNEGEDGR